MLRNSQNGSRGNPLDKEEEEVSLAEGCHRCLIRVHHSFSDCRDSASTPGEGACRGRGEEDQFGNRGRGQRS